jgi:hypothetical protein
MILRRSLLSLAAVFSLAACDAAAVKTAASKLLGPAPSPAVKPAAGAPQIWLTLVSRGIKFPMSQISQRDGVTIYASKDGTQVFLRNGILIGLGRDLMSADAPSPAALRAGSPHQRSYYDIDGTDTTIRHVFTCTVERDTAAGNAIAEACTADIGTIRNQYWFDSAGSVSKSRQWVSQGVGYAAVERKDG